MANDSNEGLYFIYEFERPNGEIVQVAGLNPRDARERYRRTYKETPKRTILK